VLDAAAAERIVGGSSKGKTRAAASASSALRVRYIACSPGSQDSRSLPCLRGIVRSNNGSLPTTPERSTLPRAKQLLCVGTRYQQLSSALS